MTPAKRARLFFAAYVRPRFVPGTECDERMLALREHLYGVTVALHCGDNAAALELLRCAADAAWLLRDAPQEGELLAYINRLCDEELSDV